MGELMRKILVEQKKEGEASGIRVKRGKGG